MDRRTVLAFVLIFLVYIAWMKIYERMYGRPDQGEAADSSAVATEQMAPAVSEGDLGRASVAEEPPASLAESRVEQVPAAAATGADYVSADGLAFISPDALPGRVVVSTQDYELEISTVGARITSWRGKQFQGIDGEPVELIPQGAEAALAGGDALLFSRRQLDLGLVQYAVTGPLVIELAPESSPRSVVFRAETTAGLQVKKTFTFHPGRYDFDVDLGVEMGAEASLSGLAQLLGDPLWARFAWQAGIASTEKNQGMEAPTFRSFAMLGEEVAFKKRQDLRKGVARVQESFRGSVKYVGQQNKYFTVAGLVPLESGEVIEGHIRLDGDEERNQQTWWIELPLRGVGGAMAIPASSRVQIFLGPCEYDLLKSYGRELEKTVDLGWKVFRPVSELVLTFMNWLHRWIPNYGVIIVILSVLTKLLFYPLTRSSTKSMRRMQTVQPKIKALNEKYKDNKEKLSQEMMKLYKEEKINPMGGCLPILVQSPVFIALYQVLSRTIALRQAPFGLWIHDLAQPDALFQLPFALPFLGSSFNLLPVLMAGSMYFQTKLTPTTSTGGQMAMLNTLMPVMMLFIFYNMPSGLVLYWLINTVMTIYQTWRIQRTTPATGGA